MSRDGREVHEAIDRWERKGLIDEGTARVLRSEAAAAREAGAARYGQYILAGTGAVVLLIAGGLFLDWSWPLMSRSARSGVLALGGFAAHLGGVHLEDRKRWRPAAYLLQTAALGLLLYAAAYSEQAWPDRTSGGVAVGIFALVVPLVLAPRSMRRNVVMPAVHFCGGLAFLALFLDRSLSLAGDEIVWTLDAVLVGSSLVLVRLLSRDPEGTRHPWALNAFATSLLAGFALVGITGAGPLSMDNGVALPLDLWLLLIAGLTLWGIHRAPLGLRRDWFADLLGWTILAWVPLGFFTAHEALGGPPELALALVSGVGMLGLVYGNREGARRVLAMSALAFIVGVWYWAVERGGALGAVLALLVTAGALFWISGRSSHSAEGRPG
jgi:hypothetical protein